MIDFNNASIDSVVINEMRSRRDGLVRFRIEITGLVAVSEFQRWQQQERDVTPQGRTLNPPNLSLIEEGSGS